MTEIQCRQITHSVVIGTLIGILIGIVIAVLHLVGLEVIFEVAMAFTIWFGSLYVIVKMVEFAHDNYDKIQKLKKESEDKSSVKNR